MYIPLSNKMEIDGLLSRVETRKNQIFQQLKRLEIAYGYTVSDWSYEVAMDRELNGLYKRTDNLILGVHC